MQPNVSACRETRHDHDGRRKGEDRFRSLERTSYDVIVVGAGIGGLTAAALLARQGAAVLVIDRHYVAGGNATIFRRPGYEFDIGLHYIGGCGPDDTLPRVLRAVGAADQRFHRLDDDAFETHVFPDFTFRVPSDPTVFGDRLRALFPNERDGIDRYCRLLRETGQLADALGNPGALLRALPHALLPLAYRNATLDRFLDTCTSHQKLRAVLAGAQLVYALPPSQVSAVFHAGVCAHYLRGAYYPRGGGQVIADRLAEVIEGHGGKILLAAEARRIHVERRHTLGVEVYNRHLGSQLVRAPAVVCNADVYHLLTTFLSADQLRRRSRRRAERFTWPLGLVSLFLGVKRDLAADGITESMFFVHPEYDVEPCYREMHGGVFYPRPSWMLTVPSFKDPDNARLAPQGVRNVQIMTVSPSRPADWGVSEGEVRDGRYRRNERYLEKKRHAAEILLEQLETLIPGVRRDIVFQEMATPLTHRRYVASAFGTGYGIAATPAQTFWRRPDVKTEIAGLYVAGASGRSGHGVVGAMASGVAAAIAVGGPAVREAVFGDANHSAQAKPLSLTPAGARSAS